MTLYGRIDRIDRGPAGERLIDYKTKAAKPLRDGWRKTSSCRPTRSCVMRRQPFTATPAAISRSIWRLTKSHRSPSIALAMSRRRRSLRGSVVAAMAAMQHGAALPAHGVDAVCRHCPASGLCRRDHVA